MSWFLIATLLVMVVGLAGSVLPGLPGVPLIFLAALVYGIYTGFAEVGWPIVALLGLFAALALVAAIVGTPYGARRFGASKWGTIGGAVGGIVGALVGLLFLGIGSLFGLILGTIAGVFLGEYLRRRERGTSARPPDHTPGPEAAPEGEGEAPQDAAGRGDWRRASRAAGGVFVGYLISAVAQGVLGLASVVIFVLAVFY
jgi:uncharacterized protein